MNLYDKDRDVIALGQFYTNHISAMTREGLHAKSDIAAELAYRDQRIAALEAEKAERDAQEPVAWVLFDDIFIAPKDMQDDPNLECMKPLYAHPLALREPTEDECSRIAIEAGHRLKTEAARIAIGRAMFNAVRGVMKK